MQRVRKMYLIHKSISNLCSPIQRHNEEYLKIFINQAIVLLQVLIHFVLIIINY